MKRILTVITLCLAAFTAYAQNFHGYVFYQKPNGGTEIGRAHV